MAIAFAREGADVLISYLPEEEEDARETARWVEQAGRRVVLVPGDIADQQHCRSIVERAVSEFGKLDILVNNAAFQRTYEKIEDITRGGVGPHLPRQRPRHVLPVARPPCRT